MKFRNLFALLLAIVLVANMITPAFAENDLGVTYAATMSSDTIDVSDTDQTFTVTINANKEFEWDSIGFKVVYDAPIVLVDITNTERTLAGAEKTTNKGSGVNGAGFMSESGENETLTNICVLTFTVPAGTEAGDYNVGIKALEITKDYGEYWEYGADVTATLTIKSAEPEHTCTPGDVSYQPGTNGQHTKVVACADANCDKNYSETVENCSGGTANCKEKAVCATCETPYGNLGDHDYGTLIQEQPAVHTETELKGAVAAHYICGECGKYFTEDKVETTLAALTGEAPVHEEDPNKTTVVTTPSSCTEGGSTVTTTFCSCGKQLNQTTTPIPAGSACELGNPEYHWADDHSTCTAQVKCQNGTVHKTETVNTTSKVTTTGDCQTEKVVTYYADFTADWAEDKSIPVTGKKDMNVHAGTKSTSYKDNGDGTHTETVTCSCGDTLSTESKGHTYGDDHKCACEKVETFTLTVTDFFGKDLDKVEVPYGAKILDYVDVTPDPYYENHEYYIQKIEFNGEWGYDGVTIDETRTMPAKDITLVPNAMQTGWEKDENGKWYYVNKNVELKSGWTLINHADYLENGTGSDWYYLDPATGYRAEGLTRVPYPTASINGVTYAPNEEDIKYAESKGEAFIDATEAWFVFGDDGKFQSTKTGIEGGKYIENGMIPWHPGFVKVDNVWYYFVGDAENGGNEAANGLIYVTRNTKAAGFENSDRVWFVDGKVDTSKNGIVDVEGVKYYFENGRVAYGKGMVEIDEGKYIFVRSGGQLAVGDYWVTADKANGCVVGNGLYNFGTDGFLTIDPNKNGIVDGVYYVEGVPYYAGLIEIEGDIYYVKSNGKIATDWYYVTKTNGFDFGTNKLYFGEDGKLQDVKNGIVEEADGKLYYYVNNSKFGAGLIKIGDDIYYVKTSTGEVVTGPYYITVTNNMEGFTPGQKCVFGEDGKLVK